MGLDSVLGAGRRVLLGEAGFEVVGDPVGFGDDGGGVRGREDFVRGCAKEGEPAFEVLRIERELEMLHHGIALVAAGCEQDGGPEVLEQCEMMRPIADDGVEDGADVGVEPDLGIEGVDESGDFGFGDAGFHGWLLKSSLGPEWHTRLGAEVGDGRDTVFDG